MKRFVLCFALAFGQAPPALADMSPLAKFATSAKLAPVAWSLDKKAYNTVHFDFDRDLLDATAKAKLRRQAAFIRKYPDIRFAVTGHTDKVGNPRYNQALGMRRAQRVVAYLVALGVDRNQLQAMVSFGEDKPVVDVEDRERRNRRVTTTVLMPRNPEMTKPAAPSTPVGRQVASTPPAEPVPTTDAGPTPTATTTTTTTTTTNDTTNRPGNSSYGTGKPDAGGGNGDEPSGDPGGSVGKNQGGDEKP